MRRNSPHLAWTSLVRPPRTYASLTAPMPTADPPFAHLHVHSRLLGPRRGVQDRPAAGPGRGDGADRRRAHRPRRDERGRRALPQGDQARHHADRRPRGLRGARPRRAAGPRAAQPPDAPRRDHRGLLQPHQALLGRLPRGLPPQAAHLARADGAARRRHHRPLRVPVRRRLLQPGARRRDGGARRARHARPDLRAATTSTWRSSTPGWTSRPASTPTCARWPRTPGCRWSRPATPTTPAARTPTPTRRSWPSRRATC